MRCHAARCTLLVATPRAIPMDDQRDTLVGDTKSARSTEVAEDAQPGVDEMEMIKNIINIQCRSVCHQAKE
jgi:hypothetical protein